jgi:hypothetical protein
MAGPYTAGLRAAEYIWLQATHGLTRVHRLDVEIRQAFTQPRGGCRLRDSLGSGDLPPLRVGLGTNGLQQAVHTEETR